VVRGPVVRHAGILRSVNLPRMMLNSAAALAAIPLYLSILLLRPQNVFASASSERTARNPRS
jgi:hypothetical protein